MTYLDLTQGESLLPARTTRHTSKPRFAIYARFYAAVNIGRETFSFLLIDEYQQFVNAAVRQQSDVLRDDNSWFDRSRAYGHINIVATQAISSLYAQVDRSAADTIVQNCQNTIVLPTTDGPTLDRAALLSGFDYQSNALRAALLNPGQQGEGFVHIANCSARSGASVAGLMTAGRVTDYRSAFMNAFIGTNASDSNRGGEVALPAVTRNPYLRARPNRCNGRLHVVLRQDHPRAREWLAELTDDTRISFVGIVDYVAQRNHGWNHRADFADYAEVIEAGDLVLIPNFNDPRQAGVLRSNRLLELVDDVREVGAGVLFGPPDDRTLELERKADGVFVSAGELISFARGLLGDNGYLAA